MTELALLHIYFFQSKFDRTIFIDRRQYKNIIKKLFAK